MVLILEVEGLGKADLKLNIETTKDKHKQLNGGYFYSNGAISLQAVFIKTVNASLHIKEVFIDLFLPEGMVYSDDIFSSPKVIVNETRM